jgi:magnesium-transporting ATPase (P-type)
MMPTNDMREVVVEISKKGLLSFLREIPKEVLEECVEFNGVKAEEEKTSKVVPCNVVLLVVVAIILLAGCFISLDQPLPLNYEYSWVVFTLISMLSLQYVDFANRLKDFLRPGNLSLGSEREREKAKKAAFLLQWTGLFFIITILALAVRIIWLSFSPEKFDTLRALTKGLDGEKAKESVEILGQAFLFFDWLIIASFILGCLLRIVVFLQSYGGDLLRRWPWKCK